MRGRRTHGERSGVADTGVRDDYVDAAEPLDRGCERSLELVLVGHIGAYCQVLVPDSGTDLIEEVGLQADEGHERPAFGELLGRLSAQASGCAGDEDTTSAQV